MTTRYQAFCTAHPELELEVRDEYQRALDDLAEHQSAAHAMGVLELVDEPAPEPEPEPEPDVDELEP